MDEMDYIELSDLLVWPLFLTCRHCHDD